MSTAHVLTMEAATTDEDRQLELELSLDATGYGHTDIVHQLAYTAASDALTWAENGEYGDLMLNSSRAALIAVTAALRALDEAGHLVPEGATVAQRWQPQTDAGEKLTGEMDVAEFETWMKNRGLRDGEHIVTLRTISTPVPREATKPAPALPLVTAEVDF